MSRKAPSAGTKVSAAPNDPIIQEGPGAVQPDSLAAESRAFRQANSAGIGSADAAPSYVENQFLRDPSGPHGRNIKEDDSIGTGDETKNASFEAEIGSKDDPSLLAERKFEQRNSIVPGSSGGRERTVREKTTYDALGDQEA
ncbi:hypothetical protein CIB48_g3921 [Xylaria polymorpha]|nr:hypothetical protein CIB48_g3921 [Xylaria polymorpha]